MPTYAIPNMTGGVDSLLVDISTAVPSFTVALLLFIFGIVFIGGSSSQKMRQGYSDTPMWSLLASISTLMVALILSLREGILFNGALGIILGVTILSGSWFFLSRGRGEI